MSITLGTIYMNKIIRNIFLLSLIIFISHYNHVSAESHGSHKINESEEVNIYSARKAYLMKPLFQAFKKDTGITVNIISGKSKELQNRIEREGLNTRADVFLTVDAGNLHIAKSKDL